MVTAAKRRAVEEGAEQRRPELAEQIAEVVLLPVDVARRVLPENGLPVYFGIGVLALVDLIDWRSPWPRVSDTTCSSAGVRRDRQQQAADRVPAGLCSADVLNLHGERGDLHPARCGPSRDVRLSSDLIAFSGSHLVNA
ncbi:hypothetical protein [Saccharopolyspora pogona]|uniref:hypothetical protein n=1 Tax=Saccharopolyspora pogona TaxID=333966 RepID=UPI001689B8EF|nr:hypothetical protein [Saccharopolyspora pogona]